MVDRILLNTCFCIKAYLINCNAMKVFIDKKFLLSVLLKISNPFLGSNLS